MIQILHIYARLRQLTATSGLVVAEEGLLSFLRQAVRWLCGERGYYRHILVRAPSYAEFCAANEPSVSDWAAQIEISSQWDNPPRFMIVTTLEDDCQFQGTYDSLVAQTYPLWQWVIVVATNGTMAMPQDERVLTVRGEKALSTLRAAVSGTNADYVIFVNAGDVLARYALYVIAEQVRKSPEMDVIYSDFDCLDDNGQRCDPLFKPDWSPEMMFSVNLLARLGVFRKSLIDAVGEFDSAMDDWGFWDYCLRVSEHTNEIRHIPQVLVHVPHPKSLSQGTRDLLNDSHDYPKKDEPLGKDGATKMLARHLRRLGLNEPVVDLAHGWPRPRWKLLQQRRISIVIPSRDHAELIQKCLSSIFMLTSYLYFEVIVVDTGSVHAETHLLYDTYQARENFQVVDYAGAFNFSRACNFGAKHANGDLLLFLNNDTQVLQADWLDLMAQWFERRGVGAVGCKLLYPSGKIQHAGVIVGLHGLADNYLALADEHQFGIFGSDDWVRNFLAVTGACIMVSREAFEQVGGFDERFILNFSDVALCLDLQALGHRVVYTPQVRLIHHESMTHKRRLPRADIGLAGERFREWLERGDPYFNPSLSLHSQRPLLRRAPPESAYNHFLQMMKNLPDDDVTSG